VGFLGFMLLYPYVTREVELYEEANILRSPVHIKPESYFLSSYAILRRVPSKGLGVLLMGAALLVLLVYPFIVGVSSTPELALRGLVVVEFLFTQVWLRFLGGAPMAQPFMLLSQLRVLCYFSLHLLIVAVHLFNEGLFSVSSD